MLPLERTRNDSTADFRSSPIQLPQPMSIPLVLSTVRRNWWLVGLTTAVAILAALVPLYLTRPVYASTARFIVNPSKNLAANREIMDSINPNNIHAVASTFAEVLVSDDLYKQAAAQLHLSDAALADLHRSSVILPDTAVVQLVVQGDDAQATAELANDVGQEAVAYADGTFRVYEFDFLDHATAAAAPIPAPWLRNFLLALVIGIGLGALLVYLREQWMRMSSTPERGQLTP